ncbi:hypothetical protein [Haloplanus natans]|uniref:hypothetical protein n=1 Tax=Haloplanus natans TaxID=376171 RepID=UPI0012F894F9|nr:hypothetical protein [Haloplanus natans]
MRRSRLVGQAFLALACLLFLGSAAGMVGGALSPAETVPYAGAALCCLVGGGILSRAGA